MKHRRINYISASIVILLASLFRFLLAGAAYFSLMQFNRGVSDAEKLPISTDFILSNILPPVVLFTEAVLYVIMRKRFFQRRIVRLHVWMTILSSIIFPIAQIIIVDVILSKTYAPVEMKQYDPYILFLGWGMFFAARLFFIIAMMRSVSSIKAQQPTIGFTGYLDEFSNTK
jgi:hypothetical protein